MSATEISVEEMEARVEFEPIMRLRKDLRAASESMSVDEARYLVDNYYAIQENRKRSDSQIRAAKEEPHAMLRWLAEQMRALETDIRAALGVWSQSRAEGRWSQSIVGIGPVLSAGLMAHIDIEKAKTAGAIWRFAGLDPTVRWEKGQKRPWNAALKVLCWKIGDSFVKQSSNEDCYYGHIYRQEKERRVAKNESGGFSELAQQTLAVKTFRDKETKALYESGKLPAGRVDLQARRKAVKHFLGDYHVCAWWARYKTLPPKPWVIVHGGHTHYAPPPLSKEMDEVLPGLREALANNG